MQPSKATIHGRRIRELGVTFRPHFCSSYTSTRRPSIVANQPSRVFGTAFRLPNLVPPRSSVLIPPLKPGFAPMY